MKNGLGKGWRKDEFHGPERWAGTGGRFMNCDQEKMSASSTAIMLICVTKESEKNVCRYVYAYSYKMFVEW